MFLSFAALPTGVKNAFNYEGTDPEKNYNDFVRLAKATARRATFSTANGVLTLEQQNTALRTQFDRILGIQYASASQRERRQAWRAHHNEVYTLIEDSIDDRMVRGWSDNPFFTQWVETRNLANGDKNEFYVRDTSLLQVSKFAGNHHDIDRQKVGPGRAFSIPTSMYGLKVYAEWDEFATGLIDWADLIDRMYRSVAQHRMGALYAMFMKLADVAPTEFKLTINSGSTTKAQVVEFAELIKSVTGYDVAFVGTKVAIDRLTSMTAYDAWSSNMKDEQNLTGKIGHWEGYNIVEIPRVNADGTTTEITNKNKLYLVPLDPEFKPVKDIYEGDVEYYEAGMNREKMDTSVEAELTYREGIALVVNQAYGDITLAD